MLKQSIRRAARAIREDAKLHVVSLSSLTVAFLCLATALWAIANLSSVADSWGRSARMSLYLVADAEGEAVEQLRLVLEGLPEVREVEHVTPGEARARFLADSSLDESLSELPADAFPASLEVTLTPDVSDARLVELVERVERFRAVDEIETYRGWFERLEALVTAGRVAAGVLASLVLLCVLFVVANTIRLAIAGRREEIEVLKLCGASDGFVRGPFLVEGAVQGFVSALLALLLLFVAFAALRGHVDATLAALAGVRTVFLRPAIALGLVLGGAVVGAAGSFLSLRRYLAV
jgi:cell division transport system permease protein